MKQWDRCEQILVGFLGLGAMGIGLAQIVSRYAVPHDSISYAEEVMVYLLIWAIMIVSSQLVRTNGHVRSDLVLHFLPHKVLRWSEAFNCTVAIVFLAGVAWYGVLIVNAAWLLDERSTTVLQFPMWIYYAALPAGAALMSLRYAIRLIETLFFFGAGPDLKRQLAAHEASPNAPRLIE
jgi:C4-dicarboxylate transporter, DctQ subunit